MIQKLYDIETHAMDYSHEERRSLRMRESTLVLDCIRKYIDSSNVTAALPKSDFAEAVRYINNHWQALCEFVKHGRIPADNNRVEQYTLTSDTLDEH